MLESQYSQFNHAHWARVQLAREAKGLTSASTDVSASEASHLLGLRFQENATGTIFAVSTVKRLWDQGFYVVATLVSDIGEERFRVVENQSSTELTIQEQLAVFADSYKRI